MGFFTRTPAAAPATAEVAGDAALSAGARSDAAAAHEADALSASGSGGSDGLPVDADREKQLQESGKWEKDEHGALVRVTSKETGEIDLKTMSWQKTAGLLFGEYVCLAIISFPWAYKILGMAGGILATLGLGIIALYTSMTLWRYCMKYPATLHIADLGYQIFGKSWLAYELTAIALLLNNTFIMGLHTLTGSEILNVLSGHGTCTLVFSIVVMVVCILGTLPRKLEHVAVMGIVSAISMGISILLLLIFTGIGGRQPAGYDPAEPVYITAWAPEGTTFVQGFNAFLNILFTWVGQICYPSFIAEMKHPEEFPKALYAVTAMEMTLFTLVGVFVYAFAGQYTETPAVAVLPRVFKQISFAFVLPTTIIIGIIYAQVVAKYLFARFTVGTKHYSSNSLRSWAIWTACVCSTWLFGWVIGESVPFFGVLLSLMSALFDGFFGFIFWALAWFELNRGSTWKGQGWRRKSEAAFNVFLIVAGVFVFGPGLYTSVQAIIDSYATGAVKRPFTCADNSI